MVTNITHNKRTAHRWPLIGLLLGGTFLALGSFWLVQVMQRPDEQGAAAKTSEPDYIVENFSFVRMGPTGQPRFVLSGARLAHRPDTDVSDIDQPVMRSMTADRPQMTVTANTAHVLNQQNQIDLVGNVVAQRPASPKSQALHVRTEAMTALPDEDILKTDQAVGIMLGASTLTGIGMEANNAKQTLHVASRGQLVSSPRPRR